MQTLEISREIGLVDTPTSDPIYLFYQFYIDKNPWRQVEILQCLRSNVANPNVEKIYLMNERIYTQKELGGVSLEKIVQVNIEKRLNYEHIFNYVNKNKLHGYIVFMNSDIFFDESLGNLCRSDLHIEKKIMAQLRFEYDVSYKLEIDRCLIFGPRYDSQDVWIIHSAQMFTEAQEKAFRFPFGKPGCDNKIVYIAKILGYQVVNDPLFVKTYHYHGSQSRNYTGKDRLPSPYSFIVPARFPLNLIMDSMGLNLREVMKGTNNMTQIQFGDNRKLHDYILTCFAKGKKFIVPRIAGVENNTAYYGQILKQYGHIQGFDDARFQQLRGVMKNNAGISLPSMNSMIEYSTRYLKAFENCEMYAGWDPCGHYIQWIQPSHDYIVGAFPGREKIWAFNFDIFHYIYSQPWTLALRGKRVLIVSAFEDSIIEKIPIREKIYGIDLFPDCTLLTVKPMQTQGNEPSSGNFIEDMRPFLDKLDKIRDDYDVALVSCGGYGNLVCNHIYESGKSAIYVGGVLQMYFGILGGRWFKERADVLRLFMNSSWSRPKESERPSNYKAVEDGCYW